ncbi:peptidase S8/S53 domain-containing protein [Epithele typhae]|uniref:peptidase S8/S53 domain-containing protein n=1 Tax=Epithele typhae TaxID=378194 RepID=UPI0020084B9E|nr:peptidase S8/S53 domain-containing protein [Epithele typhae]KAH9917405.1 peptidase S8/S53 domain-containing protein [Epithele typhae]
MSNIDSAYVGGYLFSLEAVKHLLVMAYGVHEDVATLQTALRVLSQHRDLDSPNFVPYGPIDTNHNCAQGWVLGCRLAFIHSGSSSLDVSLDCKAQAYADYWFPPHLRGLAEFKDVKYVQSRYRRTAHPTGFIWNKAKECAGEKIRVCPRTRAKWLRGQEQRGQLYPCISPPLPSTLYEDESSESESETESIMEGASTVKPRTPQVVSSDLDHCDEVMTLACLRALYNFNYDPVSTVTNSISTAQYSPEYHLESDFDVFFGNYSQDQIDQRPLFVSIDGAELVQNNIYLESSLDMQYVMGLVGPKQPVTLYQVGDNIKGGSFNTFLDAFDADYCTFDGGDDPVVDPVYPDTLPGGFTGPLQCGGVPRTLVVSTSYVDQEAMLTPAYARRQCAEYGKLSLIGITFVFGSGDTGVAGFFGDSDCLDENNQENTSTGTRFNPTSAPTSQPSVRPRLYRGTQSPTPKSRSGHAPPYSAGTFNATGRAYPDIATNGLNYSVAINGALTLVAGTSASTPTFASLVSAINDTRLAAGKAPVRWINPALYAFADAFNDVTVGNNSGCNTIGFAAVAGWDPASGLGTPDFQKLLSRFLELP